MALKGLDIFKLTPKTNCKGVRKPDLYGICHESSAGVL